jgi:hypothetical protein
MLRVTRCHAGASKESLQDPVDAVVLFTDGRASCGEASPDALELLVATALKNHRSATGRTAQIYTIGFGADHDAQVLQAISRAAAGAAFVIRSEADVSHAVDSVLRAMLRKTVCVEYLEFTASPVPGVVVGSVQDEDLEVAELHDHSTSW